MYWTTGMLNKIVDAPWPLTKYELMEWVDRTTGDRSILSNIEELEDDDEELELEDLCDDLDVPSSWDDDEMDEGVRYTLYEEE